MTRNLLVFAALVACTAFQLAMPLPTLGQTPVGSVSGVIRNSDGKPVAEAQIIAHNLNKGVDYGAASGSDGAFAIANLEPGQYEVAAVKDGLLKSAVHIEVAAAAIHRIDFSLAAAHSGPVADNASAGAASSLLNELEAMKKRIEELEAQWKNQQPAVGAASAGAMEPPPRTLLQCKTGDRNHRGEHEEPA